MKLIAPLLSLCLASCVSAGASPRPTPEGAHSPGAFRVAVLGDMPYHAPDAPVRDSIMAAYHAVLDTIAAEDVAFVVHIGDFTGRVCSDSLYAQRLREFSAMPHPFFYTFGDNEWTDCARSGFDPRERLAKLRAMFAQGETSLGRRTLPLVRQSADPRHAEFSENVRWTMGGVVFLTLHVTGSNNNRGSDTTAAAPTEFVERNAANLAWLREGFAGAEREGHRGVAIFMQANPGLNVLGGRYRQRPRPDGFAELLDELQRLAVAFRRPVALVHGDTHYFRIDQPFPERATGRLITNITRAETYGEPNFHAIVMTVDVADPNVFRFTPLIVPRNAPGATSR